MSTFKPTFKSDNYVTDTVGHTNTTINYDDFNRKYREWEIRRGFVTPQPKPTQLRGIALRSSKAKINKTKTH